MAHTSVTYHAPEGESKVMEMGGHTFLDGKATDLDNDKDADLIEKLKDHPQFKKPEGKAAGGAASDKSGEAKNVGDHPHEAGKPHTRDYDKDDPHGDDLQQSKPHDQKNPQGHEPHKR